MQGKITLMQNTIKGVKIQMRWDTNYIDLPKEALNSPWFYHEDHIRWNYPLHEGMLDDWHGMVHCCMVEHLQVAIDEFSEPYTYRVFVQNGRVIGISTIHPRQATCDVVDDMAVCKEITETCVAALHSLTTQGLKGGFNHEKMGTAFHLDFARLPNGSMTIKDVGVPFHTDDPWRMQVPTKANFGRREISGYAFTEHTSYQFLPRGSI